ncbi:tax1-binding protein 1 homolog A isoform X1 [Pimephales promelas]|uniref:tax1-binding protein 1 homolog A isoform X1 n=1 Tax=Pimephales promelas TaxID=90988 RepID=UPI0019557DE0|nr:tax1-binding protein 1 homolog A isoform X1 [Pimephales promelas]XP_039534816.1 tax1-binding protein 1 homolog A isoform X1 [Pimephales promelas]XP_039534817.1 tax1-binding protein 1 homolog A isoform X1 [Pimephales promelas]KAG1948829.1 calcium-binding and coiled-coil domain-containing protein [Pimephales promelas]KAG1948831.1 calcium-binding and coiled-coil domain-containing protein [Pimephales promelas]
MLSSACNTGVSAGVGGSVVMETSNFAHVIFQNVGKSFLPQAALECHYTLTSFITPHPKDWVGIFKVGWSSARDYYTFLWSPMPENYTEGSTVHRTIIFQGYYVPRSDGEFYQFCYVTHTGEIRGASTPFQFRPATPTGEELLTVEDEGNSDILVVTTKSGLLEQRVEEVQQECKELQKALRLLTQERDQLQERQRQQNQQELQKVLCEEKEEAQARVRQLEQDLLEITQKAVLKETELDCLKNRLQKVISERDGLQTQLKNERDERDLNKSHVRSAELENTKLSAELQMLKAVELNREVTIARYQEELHRLRTDRDTDPTYAGLKERLRQAEEQLQAMRQQAAMLGSELRDASGGRDRTMAELYRARQEAEDLRACLVEAQEECRHAQNQLDRMRSQASQEVGRAGVGVVSELEAELQKEVEELKLRLNMAAEHYKEKYRECQRLRRQVTKLTQQQEMQQGDSSRNDASTETTLELHTPDAETPPIDQHPAEIKPSMQRDAERQRDDEGRTGQEEEEDDDEEEEEEECSVSVEAELASMEEKWREQCTVNENLKLLLANEKKQFQTQLSEKDREVSALRESLVVVTREKERLEKELRQCMNRGETAGSRNSKVREPVVLRYPLPYPQDPPPLPLVPQQPAELQYGNPYSEQETRDGADGALSPEETCRPPPLAPPPWGGPVVCSQPSRSLSPPDGLENPPEERPSGGDGEAPAVCDHQSLESNESHTSFCFDTRPDVHKRCPLCEVIFPPHFEQSSFERHVESHWRVCPVCSEQFPLDCQQHLYEKHVHTHFDGNVLNFDNLD